MQNLAQAAKQNPNQAGEAQRISQKTGMPSGLVQTDLDEMKRQAYLQDVQQRRLATTNPILARQLQDPEFAAIAHDQIDQLSGIEGMFKRLSEVPGNISTQFKAGRLQTEQSLLGYDKMAGTFGKDQKQRLDAVTEELRKSYAGDNTFEGNVASLVGQMSYTLPEVWTYAGATGLGFGAMGAMVGGPLAEVTGPGAAALGMTIGGAYKASEMAMKQEAGGAYLDMTKEGINPKTATYAATGVGLINAALEELSFGVVTAPFRKYAARKIGVEVAESLAKPTMRSALVEFGKKYIEAIGSESATEVLQEISSIAGEEIAKTVDGLKTKISTPEGQQELFDRLIEIARKTAEGMSVVGVVGPSFNLKHDYKRAKVAERQAEFFTNLNQAADNEIVKRNPVAYQRFLQVQTDGAAVENVYIDPEQFVNVLNQSKVTREQIDQVIPGISTQIDEAVKTGRDIVIPTGDYGAKVAGTDLGNALLPHVKLTPDAFSMVEAEEFQKEKEQMLSDAAVLLKEKSETEQAFVDSAREVKGLIEDQIKATGIYRDEEARTMSTMMQAAYVTQAAELGVTPKELYDKFQNPVVLAGEQQPSDVSHPNIFNQDVSARQAKTFNEAKTAARDFIGKELTNQSNGMIATVSKRGLGKMLSQSAVEKSDDAFLHSYAVANLDKLFERAIWGWSKEDSKGGLGLNAVHRLLAGFTYNGESRIAKITVKEHARDDQGNKIYTIEAVDLNKNVPGREWTDSTVRSDGLDPTSILHAGDIYNLADAVENNKLRQAAIQRDRSKNPRVYNKNVPGREWTDATIKADGLDPTSILHAEDIYNLVDAVEYNKLRQAAIQRDRSKNPRVYFEVAPDPHNNELTARWNALSSQEKLDISQRVASNIVPKVLKELGTDGRFEMQTGGYEGATNPSMALDIDNPERAIDAAKMLGHILSQDSMFVVSGEHVAGTTETGAIVLSRQGKLTAKEAEEIYNKLWELESDGHKLINGYTLDDGHMIMLNQSDKDTRDLADLIDRHLGSQYLIEDGKVFSSLVTKKDYGYASDTRGEMARGTPAVENADILREQSAEAIQRELDARDAGGTDSATAGTTRDVLHQSSRSAGSDRLGATDNRGGFDPRTMTTILSQQSDLSTYLHESGHFYLEFMSRLAAMPEATEQMKADMQAILDWFGVADLTTWQAMSLEEQRRYHEQWAYNYEIYLSEGKAPSVKLQKIFDRFSQWMRRVYKSIRDDLNEIFKAEHGTDLPILTGEVRQVMDRMLASEEEIKQAESIRSMAPLFQDKQQSGMDDATWAAYQDILQEAHDAAVTDLTKSSIRQLKWLGNARSRILKALQKETETIRNEVLAEVAEEVRNEPVYRAERFIRKGELDLSSGANRDARRTSIEVGMEGSRKLDSDAVKEMFGEEDDIWKTFREKGKVGLMGPNGLHPDVVAEMVGFDSGHALVIALANSRPINEVIEERTGERMMAEHSEMNDPAARELAVEQALHNEARARFVAVELRFLSKATAPVKVITAAAKQVARQIISGKKLGDIRPRDYSTAEARAAREAEKAMKKGDSMVAVKKKQDQLLQNHLAAQAVEARQSIEKSIDYLKRIQNDAARKRIGADYADQIQALLYRFGLASDMPIGDRLILGQWLDAQEESGFAPDIAAYLVDERFSKPVKEMTMSEFEDLVDAAKQIYHIGKNQQKLLASGKNAEYQAARDEIVDSIESNASDRTAKNRTPTTNLGRIEKGLKKFWASHIKAAMAARTLDGGKDAGPLWEYLIRPANERADMETRLRAEATEALTKILDPVFKQGKMGGKGRYFPSIGRSLNRESVLTIALNCGNAGNMQRLLDGEGWTLEQVMPILETLTSEELDAVQKIWDHFEAYRPMIAAKERRVYGKEPKWIEPAAITIKSADGQDVTLAGGYYPVVYDAAASQRAEEFADAEQAKRDLRGAFTSATTRRSFTKSRAEKVVDRPLVYTLSGLYNGVNEVIHDLAWHEWLIDANRLLRSKSIDNAIRSHYGDEFKGIFKSWAKDIAGGDRRADTEAALSWIRQGVSAAGLGFNVMSAILQVTGFTGSIVRVGAKWIGRGVYLAGKDLRTASKDVNEKSDFMADRARTQNRELADLRNRVQDETDIERRIKTGTYLMMMGMQRVVDVPTWLGAYEKAIVEGEHDEETAVALADQAVRDSQGSGLTSDLSAIERGGPAMKLFTVFYSYMNTVFNLGITSAMTQKSKGKLAADMLLLYVVPVILNKAIKDALTPDDDDDDWDMGKIARELISEELSYLMGNMVVAREISDIPGIFLHTNKGRSYSGPAGLRNIAELHTFSQQAAQWEFDDAFRKTAINLVGNFTGLPAAQINRTISGAKALQEGKTSNPMALLFGVQ
jgi:hypothetical protein